MKDTELIKTEKGFLKIPLEKCGHLITITTMKKKFVDQLDYLSSTDTDTVKSIIGKCGIQVLVKTINGKIKRIRYVDFIAETCNAYRSKEPDLTHTEATEKAYDLMNKLPQIFEDQEDK